MTPYQFPEGEWPAEMVPLQPAAVAQSEALALLAKVDALEAEQDPHLTPAGQRAKRTDALAADLPRLAAHVAKLDALADATRQEAEALATAHTPPSEGAEADAAAIGRLAPAERSAVVEAALTGKDARALRALAHAPAWLCGVAVAQQERALAVLREGQGVPEDQRERLAERAHALGRVRGVVESVATRIEQAVDRQALRERGVALPLHRADLGDDAAKAAWIAAHGLAAFKALPA